MSKIKSGYDSNGAVLSVGDHLRSPRLGYSHHGLYVGNDSVIHYSGFVNGMSAGEIEVTSIDAFRHGNPLYIESHFFRRYDGDESVDRAYSRLGEDWYNVLLNNCEHFVSWCINGIHSSEQVNMTVGMIAGFYSAQQKAQQAEQAAHAVHMLWRAYKTQQTVQKGDLIVRAANGLFTAYRAQQTAQGTGLLVSSLTSAMAAKSASTTAATVAASNLATITAGAAAGAATTSLATSSVAGTAAGIVAGAAASSSAGLIGGASAAAVGLVGSAAVAPAVAAAGVAVAAGYGVKKVWDWLTD